MTDWPEIDCDGKKYPVKEMDDGFYLRDMYLYGDWGGIFGPYEDLHAAMKAYDAAYDFIEESRKATSRFLAGDTSVELITIGELVKKMEP